jgi:hypothetical protein
MVGTVIAALKALRHKVESMVFFSVESWRNYV